MSERTGRCLCGAVTCRLAADPVAARLCWSHDCQRTASNGTFNSVVPDDALQIHGTLAEYVSTADSGNTTTRRYCPQYGSHVCANSSGRPQFRWCTPARWTTRRASRRP